VTDQVELDDLTVEAIDKLAARAPGVQCWWRDLIPIGKELREHYAEGKTFPESLRPQKYQAYLAAYLPWYLPRFHHALRAAGLDLSRLLDIKSDRHVSILDLGCGPGTLTVATLNELQRVSKARRVTTTVSVTLWDMDEYALSVAGELIEYLENRERWPDLRITWSGHCRSLLETHEDESESYDLVTIGHVFCEMARKGVLLQGLESTSKLLHRILSPVGVVVIIEPTNRDFLGRFLELRDELRSRTHLHVLGPCLGLTLRCPERDRDTGGVVPACSGAIGKVYWNNAIELGRRLTYFTQQLQGKSRPSPRRPLTIHRTRSYSSLILGRGNRAVVPPGVGTAVRRWGREEDRKRRFICMVGDDGLERIVCEDTSDKDNPRFTAYQTVAAPPGAWGVDALITTITRSYELSALYPRGWPVVG
jgi:SAM-dependent methyltransferase